MRTLRFLVFTAATFSVAAAQPDTTATAARVDNPRTVVVGERSVVDIYVSQFQDTLIVLPTSEKVRQTFVGDSANWVLTTGKSEEPTRYISVKVKDPIVKQTTVNVLSDHDKSYTFRLIMSGDHCDSKVFIDPDSQLSQELAKPAVFVPAAEVDRAKKEAADAKTAADQAIEQEKTKARSESESFRAKYPGTLRFDYHWDLRQ
jgi:type IV secretion system protein VirB9